MKLKKLPALIVAFGLQLSPLVRTFQAIEAVSPTGFAVVLRWLVGASAFMGAIDAVSGASAAIAGVFNNLTPGPVSTNAAGVVGANFSYRIIVTNPGVNPQQDYWNAVPLPPGLTIATNTGANGYITGVPTLGGVYHVLLTAGNRNYAGVVTKEITITITGGAAPPTISTSLTNETVTIGSNVAFTVGASGTAPLSYVWKFGSATLSANAATLQLNNVTTNNAGVYTVIVSNAGGSVTNSATLSVLTPLSIASQPTGVIATDGSQVSFAVEATGSSLTYDWRRNGASLGLPSTNRLVLSAVTGAQSGAYTVVVNGSGSSLVSNPAQLLVVSPPTSTDAPMLALDFPLSARASLSFSNAPGFAYSLQSAASPEAAAWAILSNVPPAFTGGVFNFIQTNPPSASEFYRVLVSAP